MQLLIYGAQWGVSISPIFNFWNGTLNVKIMQVHTSPSRSLLLTFSSNTRMDWVQCSNARSSTAIICSSCAHALTSSIFITGISNVISPDIWCSMCEMCELNFFKSCNKLAIQEILTIHKINIAANIIFGSNNLVVCLICFNKWRQIDTTNEHLQILQWWRSFEKAIVGVLCLHVVQKKIA